ncbi:MAG: hypothetical protein AAF404_10370 [Pseudomonadota bacterium]
MRILLAFILCVVVGCSGGSLDNSPVAAAKAEAQPASGVVQVLLDPQAPASFTPFVSQRLIYAEPFSVTERTVFEHTGYVDGIEVVRIVDSCDLIAADYTGACRAVTQADNIYGPIESSVLTNAAGRAQLSLANTSYRLRLEPTATIEDEKCYWGGSVIIEQLPDTEVVMPLLVYCEAG